VLTEADLVDFVKERVAACKYPRLVEFRAEMEHGPTGKILETALR
jgi:long-chain acyl-CoA synthetase